MLWPTTPFLSHVDFILRFKHFYMHTKAVREDLNLPGIWVACQYMPVRWVWLLCSRIRSPENILSNPTMQLVKTQQCFLPNPTTHFMKSNNAFYQTQQCVMKPNNSLYQTQQCILSNPTTHLIKPQQCSSASEASWNFQGEGGLNAPLGQGYRGSGRGSGGGSVPP